MLHASRFRARSLSSSPGIQHGLHNMIEGSVTSSPTRCFAISSKKKALDASSAYRTFWYMSPIVGIPISYRSVDVQHSYHLLLNKSNPSKDLHADQKAVLERELSLTKFHLENPEILPREKNPFDRLPLSDVELKGFDKAKISVAAFSVAQCPPIRDFIRDAEVVVAGRSNVGKSSLLNALFGNQQALASQRPGKTQSLNFYPLATSTLQRHRTRYEDIAACSPSDLAEEIKFMDGMRFGMDEPPSDAQAMALHYMYTKAGHSPVMMIVDVPGYGFARAPEAAVDTWNYLIGGYIKQRAPARWPVSLGLGKARGTSPPLTPIASNSGFALYKETPSLASGQETSDGQKKKRLGKPPILGINVLLGKTALKTQVEANERKAAENLLLGAAKAASRSKKDKKGRFVVGGKSGSTPNSGVDGATNVVTKTEEEVKRDVDVNSEEKDIAIENLNHSTVSSALDDLWCETPALSLAGPPHGSNLRLALVLVDARAGISKHDKQFCDFLEAHAIPYQVYLTKVDRMGPFSLRTAVQQVAKVLFPNAQAKHSGTTESSSESSPQNNVTIENSEGVSNDENQTYDLFNADGSLNLKALTLACENDTSDAPVFKIHADLPFAKIDRGEDRTKEKEMLTKKYSTETGSEAGETSASASSAKPKGKKKSKRSIFETTEKADLMDDGEWRDQRAEAPAAGLYPDRKYCSPLLITLSSNSDIGINTLKKAMLSACIV